MQKFIYPNALNSTEAPAVVTCAAHSTSIYYCSPDKSLHPIRFIWAWHAAGIFFYPPVFPRRVSFFFSSLPINGLKMTGRERHIPYNIDTLWSVYLLTQPQISSDTNQIRGARGERRGRGRGGGDANLKVRNCSYLVFIYSPIPLLGGNNYSTGRPQNS